MADATTGVHLARDVRAVACAEARHHPRSIRVELPAYNRVATGMDIA
jgi:hypothetical protein